MALPADLQHYDALIDVLVDALVREVAGRDTADSSNDGKPAEGTDGTNECQGSTET